MGLGTWAGLGAFKCSPLFLISGAGNEKETLSRSATTSEINKTKYIRPMKREVAKKKKEKKNCSLDVFFVIERIKVVAQNFLNEHNTPLFYSAVRRDARILFETSSEEIHLYNPKKQHVRASIQT